MSDTVILASRSILSTGMLDVDTGSVKDASIAKKPSEGGSYIG